MTVLKKEVIGSGINKVTVATKFAKGIDMNTGKQTKVATEVKTFYSHNNRVFDLVGLKKYFDTPLAAQRQLRYINTLYSVCNTTDRAILLFSLNDNTEVLLRCKLGRKTIIVNAQYTSTGELNVIAVNDWFETTDIEEIARQMCGKHPDKYSDWRWLTINANQSPNKRRLTIADALSRR